MGDVSTISMYIVGCTIQHEHVMRLLENSMRTTVHLWDERTGPKNLLIESIRYRR